MLRLIGPLLLAAIAVSPVRAGSDQIEPAPMPLTTDTAEYCRELSRYLDEHTRHATPPPPPTVMALSTEGRQYCAIGLVRGGIARLRRAIWILLRPTASP
jgi:hypothetical protein